MASRVYNIGSYELRNGGAVNFATDTIEVVALKSSYTFSAGHTAGTPAASEITGVSGYVNGFGGAGRKVLGSKTITNDTANDRLVYDAADPGSYGALGAGDTIGGWLVQKKGSASDTTAVPLFFLDNKPGFPPDGIITNGGTVSLAFDAGGIAYVQN